MLAYGCSIACELKTRKYYRQEVQFWIPPSTLLAVYSGYSSSEVKPAAAYACRSPCLDESVPGTGYAISLVNCP
jgi:hypothetical protein